MAFNLWPVDVLLKHKKFSENGIFVDADPGYYKGSCLLAISGFKSVFFTATLQYCCFKSCMGGIS